MKARLLRDSNEIKLILCSGKVMLMDNDAIRDFFCSYKNTQNFDMVNVIPEFVDRMILSPGETLAYINDRDEFVVCDPHFFKGLFTISAVDYITAQEFAERHQKTSVIIKRYCRENRIPGAIKLAGRWCVPENAKYPEDARFGKN